MNLGPTRQKGVVLPLTVISLFAVFGMAALALDMSHLYLNKSRLQNAVDAAALSAAKRLDMTGDTVAATDAAGDTFTRNLNGPGNQEMQAALAGADPTVQFSSTVNPFVPGAGLGPYVRVQVSGFNADSWFAGIWGMDQVTAGASAVAGPTPTTDETCNTIPVLACGDPDGGEMFGFQPGQVVVLKTGAHHNPLGPGNFQFLRVGGNRGAWDMRDSMAIGEECMRPGDVLKTEPGNTVGPGVTGVAQRFEPCSLELNICPENDIRPDMVSTGGITYAEYTQAYADENFQFPDPLGKPERRVVAVPIGECTGTVNGHTELDFLGFGCFFLTGPMVRNGYQAELEGEFLGRCGADEDAAASPVPSSGPGFYRIVLYKDSLSGDS